MPLTLDAFMEKGCSSEVFPTEASFPGSEATCPRILVLDGGIKQVVEDAKLIKSFCTLHPMTQWRRHSQIPPQSTQCFKFSTGLGSWVWIILTRVILPFRLRSTSDYSDGGFLST